MALGPKACPHGREHTPTRQCTTNARWWAGPCKLLLPALQTVRKAQPSTPKKKAACRRGKETRACVGRHPASMICSDSVTRRLFAPKTWAFARLTTPRRRVNPVPSQSFEAAKPLIWLRPTSHSAL